MKQWQRLVAPVVVVSLAAGCANTDSSGPFAPRAESDQLLGMPVNKPAGKVQPRAVPETAPPRPAALARPAPPEAGVPAAAAAADTSMDKGEPVQLHFVDSDIQAVLRGLGTFTGRHFLVDPRVKGNLTLVSDKPVPASTAYRMLAGALRMQGYAIVESGNISRVVPEADAKLQGGAVNSSGAAGGVVTRTFRLSYENATNLVPVLRPMIAANNTIQAYPGNNTLVITDYEDNLERIGRIIASIDTPAAMDMDVVRMRNGIAVDVAASASQLLDAQGGDPTQRISVVADPRANSVMIRSSSPARTRLARELLMKLDASHDDGGNLHVVYLRNAQALHLARVLRGLLTGEADDTRGHDPVRAALSSAAGSSSAKSGTASAPVQTTAASAPAQGSLRSGVEPGSAAMAESGPPSAAFSAGGATVQADSATNTLLIAAPEPLYRSMRKIIDALDQRRAQVLVESLIVEVTENNASELGIQWMAGNAGRVFGGTRFSGAPGLNANATTTINAMPAGLNIGVVKGSISLPGVGEILNLKMLATALQTQGGANILSTPNLLTLDNEPARIMVGKTVPFVSGSYITSGNSNNNPFQTVEREDIGLKLNIRPQISEGGTVKLDIYQEVSSIDGQLSGDAGIVTNKRALDTSVLLDDGQIMVLGGLLEDSVTVGTEAVPVLGAIPGLGALFRYDKRSRVKTNLMIFLRPYVVRDNEDTLALTQSRYDFMRRAQGRVRPASHWALPDMAAPVLPPARVMWGDAYDLRPEQVDATLRRDPPQATSSEQTRQLPETVSRDLEREQVRSSLPRGVTVAANGSSAPAAVLQFADTESADSAQRIVHRARMSGVKAYSMTGPGGMGYVVRADLAPAALESVSQVLYELGYRPEIVVAP